MDKPVIVAGSVLAGCLLIAGAWLWLPGRTDATTSASAGEEVAQATGGAARQGNEETSLLRQRSKGDPNAPITVLEASDFQCPYCRQFWEETLPVLEREYIQTGKIRFIFLNLPLLQIHPNAAAAHEFAMCAAVQDKFWPVHDLLYRHQRGWATLDEPGRFFLELADSAKLDLEGLGECFDSGQLRGLIMSEAQMAFQAGIRSTPSFVVEGGLLAGAAPITDWRPILDSIYKAKTGN